MRIIHDDMSIIHDDINIISDISFAESVHHHTKPNGSDVNTTVSIYAICGVNASIFADVDPEGELEARLSCRDRVQIVGNGEALDVWLDGIFAHIESAQ